jgi:hypothetical protein
MRLRLSLLTAGGDLDPTFGSGGTVVTDFAATPDFGEAVALQPDGQDRGRW